MVVKSLVILNNLYNFAAILIISLIPQYFFL